MGELDELLERQRREQQRLRNLPWPEKVRMVERARHAIETLRKTRVGRDAESGGLTNDRAES